MPTAAAAAAPVVERTPPRTSLVQKLQDLVTNLLLAIAQLLDLPFGWLNDLSRNVIGMAAFLLLLGGAVLWFMAQFKSLGGS